MANYKDYVLQNVLPSDENAECNVIGAIISHEELFNEIDDILSYDMFYNPSNKALFRIIRYIIRKGQIIDESSVAEYAEKFKGETGIPTEDIKYKYMEVCVCDGIRTFQQDVDRMIDYNSRRRAWQVLQKAAQDIITLTENADDVINSTVKSLDDTRGDSMSDDGIIDAKAAVKMVYGQINDNLSGLNKSCIKTGYKFTDAKGGLRLSSVLIIGAWTSVGKTALALNMARNIAISGTPVAYYSMEMPAVELWARIISGQTNISAGKILNYPLKRQEVSTIDESVTSLMDIPLYIDDKSTTSFKKTMRSIRRLHKKLGIKVFFIDYLQIFAQNSKGSSEESTLGSMAREIKNICKELNIIGVPLSQLRRDKEERHPTIDMLRGSGQLEESADNIALIDRPEAHPEWGIQSFYGNSSESIVGKAEIRVCKGRNIGLGTYYVGFEANRTEFYELDGYRIGDEIGYDDGGVQTAVDEDSEETVERDPNMPF